MVTDTHCSDIEWGMNRVRPRKTKKEVHTHLRIHKANGLIARVCACEADGRGSKFLKVLLIFLFLSTIDQV